MEVIVIGKAGKRAYSVEIMYQWGARINME